MRTSTMVSVTYSHKFETNWQLSTYFVHQSRGPSLQPCCLEVVTVVRCSPLGVCISRIPGGVMVIVNLENLLNEVSPQVTPFSLAQVCALRTPFTIPVQ